MMKAALLLIICTIVWTVATIKIENEYILVLAEKDAAFNKQRNLVYQYESVFRRLVLDCQDGRNLIIQKKIYKCYLLSKV